MASEEGSFKSGRLPLRAPFPYFGGRCGLLSILIVRYAWSMTTTESRFWEKIDKGGPLPAHYPELGPCWIWMASKRNKGYGAFVYPLGGDIVQGRAHRYSWELHNGPIPTGLCVLHRCDNPPCVNPAHLWLGTKAENNLDMTEKGRRFVRDPNTNWIATHIKRGNAHHAAKMTPDTVRSMRVDYESGMFSFSQLSRKYDIAIGATHRIVRRKAWRHVQ